MVEKPAHNMGLAVQFSLLSAPTAESVFTFSLLDEICRRSLNVINACIYNGSSLVRAVTNYGIQYSRHISLLGHNLLFCARFYNCSAQCIIRCSVNRLVNNYTSKLVIDYQLQTASFVREMVLIREGTL